MDGIQGGEATPTAAPAREAKVSTSSSSSSSSQRKAIQRKWAKAPDWLAAMPTIRRLYKDERKTLKEVMDIMEKQHNFYATPKMYKSKLKEWDISKSFKAQEILAILHAMEGCEAEGKPAQFVMRGQEVDLQWVRHYIKRNRSRMKIDVTDRKRSPSSVGEETVCRTLAPRPAVSIAAAPGAMRSAEELIRAMNSYIEGSWASNQWFVDTYGVLRSRKGERGRLYLLRLWGLLDKASQLMSRSEKVDLVGMLDPAFAYLDDIVRDECPRAVPFLLSAFEVLHQRGRRDLTEMFLKYIRNLSVRILGPRHPQTRVWEHATEIQSGEHDEVFQRFFSWMIEIVRYGSPAQPCRLDKAIKNHTCTSAPVLRELETHESRLRLHIRMIEQDCRNSFLHDSYPRRKHEPTNPNASNDMPLQTWQSGHSELGSSPVGTFGEQSHWVGVGGKFVPPEGDRGTQPIMGVIQPVEGWVQRATLSTNS